MIVERPVAAQESPAPSHPLTPTAVGSPTAGGPAFAPEIVAPSRPPARRADRWEARHDLARFRAETERVRALVDFLARPVHAHGGADPDPDIVTAYNLAVEAALVSVRRAAQAITAS